MWLAAPVPRTGFLTGLVGGQLPSLARSCLPPGCGALGHDKVTLGSPGISMAPGSPSPSMRAVLQDASLVSALNRKDTKHFQPVR